MKKSVATGMLSVAAAAALLFAACGGGKEDGGDAVATFVITFNAGRGSGVLPENRTVAAGTVITLPDKGGMTAPSGKFFGG
ncbi:MAG: hypothetical protein LBL45_00350 [Treponema sp.]|jgi:hypothetical protein|nr:hypothetical protein [Treponema sp.]